MFVKYLFSWVMQFCLHHFTTNFSYISFVTHFGISPTYSTQTKEWKYLRLSILIYSLYAQRALMSTQV